MKLRIEHGILLKPYSAPHSRKTGQHRKPNGWTPEHTPEMQARFVELKTSNGDAPDMILWFQVEQERGDELARLKRPYPGWFPVRFKSDKDISKAYRELFLRMNPDFDTRVKLGNVWSGPKAQYPPDGDYIFEDGVMELVGVSDLTVKTRINKIASEALR